MKYWDPIVCYNVHCFLLYFQSPRAHKRQGLSSPTRDAEERVCMALTFCVPKLNMRLLKRTVESVHREQSNVSVNEICECWKN